MYTFLVLCVVISILKNTAKSSVSRRKILLSFFFRSSPLHANKTLKTCSLFPGVCTFPEKNLTEDMGSSRYLIRVRQTLPLNDTPSFFLEKRKTRDALHIYFFVTFGEGGRRVAHDKKKIAVIYAVRRRHQTCYVCTGNSCIFLGNPGRNFPNTRKMRHFGSISGALSAQNAVMSALDLLYDSFFLHCGENKFLDGS